MKEHNIIALYETLARLFAEKENCTVNVTVKQNEK